MGAAASCAGSARHAVRPIGGAALGVGQAAQMAPQEVARGGDVARGADLRHEPRIGDGEVATDIDELRDLDLFLLRGRGRVGLDQVAKLRRQILQRAQARAQMAEEDRAEQQARPVEQVAFEPDRAGDGDDERRIAHEVAAR